MSVLHEFGGIVLSSCCSRGSPSAVRPNRKELEKCQNGQVQYGGQPILICSRQYEDEDHGQATPQISIEIQRWVPSGSEQKDAGSSEPSKRSVVRLSILRVITYRCHSSTTHPPICC